MSVAVQVEGHHLRMDRAAAPKSWKPAEGEVDDAAAGTAQGARGSAGQHEARKTVFVGNLDFKVRGGRSRGGGRDWGEGRVFGGRGGSGGAGAGEEQMEWRGQGGGWVGGGLRGGVWWKGEGWVRWEGWGASWDGGGGTGEGRGKRGAV